MTARTRRAAGRSADGLLSRRDFLTLAAAVCCSGAALAAVGENTPRPARVVIDGVDRFRVREPMFEGVRIVLDFLGEKYTPAYIQGISGAAFRFAGPCPCAPNVSVQMSTPALLKVLGYESTESILGWDAGDVEMVRKSMTELIPKIKEALRARRPVLLWYGFADSAYEVVTGFDDGEGVFLGWHMHQGPKDGLAKAKQRHAEECVTQFPAIGGLFVGKKTGKLNAKAAELVALKEAVRHGRDRTVSDHGPARSGLLAYDGWVEKFKRPEAKRDGGDSHCHNVYRSTHRAAAGFLNGIAPKYRHTTDLLRKAAAGFAAEADALDRAEPLIGWSSPEQDEKRNAKLWPLLAQARDHYAAGIGCIEQALPRLS